MYLRLISSKISFSHKLAANREREGEIVRTALTGELHFIGLGGVRGGVAVVVKHTSQLIYFFAFCSEDEGLGILMICGAYVSKTTSTPP